MTVAPSTAPLPWSLDTEAPGTVIDATGSFVLDAWLEDSAFVVTAVNSHDLLLTHKALLLVALECERAALDRIRAVIGELQRDELAIRAGLDLIDSLASTTGADHTLRVIREVSQ